MTSAAIRDLKNRLSEYVRRAEGGQRIAVTAHGRVVAELVPPAGRSGTGNRYTQLIADGTIRPGTQGRSPLAAWPAIRLPAGSVAALIDSDRG